MADSGFPEVAILFVREQRGAAETLTRELQRRGVAVFCDYFENTEMAPQIAAEDFLPGLVRADLVVVLLSRQFLDRAWEREERGLTVCEIFKKNCSGVMVLRFDDVLVPTGLTAGIDCRGADDYKLAHVAKTISEESFGHLLQGEDSVTPRSPQLTALTGESVFLNYDYGGQFVIGQGERTFETGWSKCNATSIHVYNDAPSIQGVALASGYTAIEQIIDARFLDYTDRTRTPREGEIVLFRNVNSFYAAVQVLDVKDNTHGDEIDELRFRYVILPDRSDDFGGGSNVKSVRVSGFRSLRSLELGDLGRLVAMIGPNGCGKSNLFKLFQMMNVMLGSRRLGNFVGEHGGGDDQLFNGSKVTPRVDVEVTLRVGAGNYYDYRFSLTYGSEDRLLFADEAYRLRKNQNDNPGWQLVESSTGLTEPGLVAVGHAPHVTTIYSRIAGNIVTLLGNCRVYQFHHTSRDSGLHKPIDIQDNGRLETGGHNLAAVLLYLERNDLKRYEIICNHIARVLPGFDRFDLQELGGRVSLRWSSNYGGKTFGGHLTSDGALRLFALVTLLNLPSEMLPTAVLLDEPELGLHPAGIALIGGMIKALSYRKQVMVATQSPLLIDAFELDEVVVMEIDKKGTRANTLSSTDYKDWLDEGFLPSDLWQKNLLGGRP